MKQAKPNPFPPVVALLALLLSVAAALSFPPAISRYAITGIGSSGARIAIFYVDQPSRKRFDNKGVAFAVDASEDGSFKQRAALWQGVALYNYSEVWVEVNLWVTVSDSEDAPPEPDGTKYEYCTMAEANSTGTVFGPEGSDYEPEQILQMNADREYPSLMAKNQNMAKDNNNETLWTVRLPPGKCAYLRINFDVILDYPLVVDGVTGLGGCCRLWYQAIQID